MDFLQSTLSILKEGIGFDPDRAWLFSMDHETQDLILHLLTKKQLGNEGEGIDGDGKELKEYTSFTKFSRASAGFQIDHTSFEVTGRYLNETDVGVINSGWVILKDEDRFFELTEDLGFSDQHMKLTSENEQTVFKMIREKYTRYVETS